MQAAQKAHVVPIPNDQPIQRFVYFAVVVAAIGGLLFGYDTGVISGAILFITRQFGLSSMMEEIVVSAVLVGAILGASLGGALTDRLGRRSLIMVAGVIFIASSLGTALAPTVPWLIAARAVSGIAIGLASFISPMYIAELVPARVRGALVAVNMLAITTGIVSAYLVDYALTGNGGWRWMFGLGVVPAVALTVGMWFLPDSSRWLISKARLDEARHVLMQLRRQLRLPQRSRIFSELLSRPLSIGRCNSFSRPCACRFLSVSASRCSSNCRASIRSSTTRRPSSSSPDFKARAHRSLWP